jgi:glutamyl-tRNA synthetase
MAANSRFFFVEAVEIDPKAAAKHLTADARSVLQKVRKRLTEIPEWTAAAIHGVVEALSQELQAGLGKIAQPIRVAVSGTAVSPPIDQTLELLGRERTLARLDSALARIT